MKNPLYLLVAAQTFFVVLGKTRLEFNLTWTDIAAVVLTALAAELLFSYLEKRNAGQPFTWFFPASAAAAALGLAIFLRATNPLYFAFAALVAVGSKYVVRTQGRHIFNPSNIAIVSMILLFPSATTVELTQWGNNIYVYPLIAAISFCIAYYSGVWLTTVSFLLSYTALLLISIPYHLDILAVHHYGLLGPSLVLFASFMITDPRTSPSGTYPRILQGASVAAAFFLFELLSIRYSIFLASFAVTLLTALSAPLLGRLKLTAVLPRNSVTFALFMVAMGTAYVGTVGYSSAKIEFTGISPSFLLMGVESASIRTCSSHPSFTPGSAISSTPSMTTGAAWGDYDRDGRDDLFVSNLDVPSRLYRNGPDGFTDVTAPAGLPDINSQSAFFADYDNDGNRDLFVVYGVPDYLAAAAGQPMVQKPPVSAVRVFRNTGGHFTEVTQALGLAGFTLPPSGGSLSFADYNNDGFLDFVFAQRANFYDISPLDNRALLKAFYEPYLSTPQRQTCEPAQVTELLRRYAGAVMPDPQTQAAYVKNGGCMITVSRIPVRDALPGSRAADNPPNHEETFVEFLFQPGSAHLFENRAGKGFIEKTSFAAQLRSLLASSSVQYYSDGAHPHDDISGSFYQPVSFDYNSDRLPDLYLSIDMGTNLLLRNDGGFSFSNVTAQEDVNYAGTGMGADIGDYDNDGTLDIVSGNVRKINVFKGVPGAAYQNESKQYSLNTLGVAWGINFFDYNLDGRDDLYIGNGNMELITDVPRLDLTRPLYRSDKLYKNTGKGFSDVSAAAFCPADGQLTRTTAVADYDNDGRPDLFVGYFASGLARTPPTLFRNRTTGGHYLAVTLQGTVSNRDAAGAVVSVTSQGQTQTKPLLLGNSFYAENSTKLIFGTGDSTQPVDVEVRWPSGRISRLPQTPVDQTLTVREDSL